MWAMDEDILTDQLQASLDGRSVHIWSVTKTVCHVYYLESYHEKTYARETVTLDIVGTHAVGITTP